MADQLSRPTVDIEGIGERASALLRAAGIHTVGDLLRVTPVQVHNIVSGQASLEVAQSWYQMAALLQVAGVTPPWAEALASGGVADPGDLRYRTLSDVREMFVEVREDGRIEDEPSDQQLFEIVKDAMLISNTGGLNGTVQDEDGNPVPNATVAVGKEKATTDARGHFRITRIAWWSEASLFVSHPDYLPAHFPLRRVYRSGTVHSQRFQLAALPEGGPVEPTVLMEVRGERLPPLGDSQLVAREVNQADLLRRDILTVVELSADGTRVKLVSKLLVWTDGRFEMPYAWFPAAELPSTKPGDCYVVGVNRLEPITMTARRLRTWIGLLRARRQVGPRPSDPQQLDAWLAQVTEVMRESAISGDRRF